MVTKKICMVGAFAVGKTSLVRRFVHSIFSEVYQTTIGVMISKKTLAIDGQEYQLMIWDLEGRDELSEFRTSYLRGSAGILYVADVTRPQTLTVLKELRDVANEALGKVPHVVLLNKSDLMEETRVDGDLVLELKSLGDNVFNTSAKTGLNVEMAFETLLGQIIKQNER